MWGNYFLLIIRRPKSWDGLTIINLLGLVVVYAILIFLVNSFLTDRNLQLGILVGLTMLVAIMAYINYIALQLKKRVKEIYVRKLLGASRSQLMGQLVLESAILTTFLVVSGMVLMEIIFPICDKYMSGPFSLLNMPFAIQIMEISLLVIPIGILAAIIPIQKFIAYINKNFTRLANPHFLK